MAKVTASDASVSANGQNVRFAAGEETSDRERIVQGGTVTHMNRKRRNESKNHLTYRCGRSRLNSTGAKSPLRLLDFAGLHRLFVRFLERLCVRVGLCGGAEAGKRQECRVRL